MPRRPAPTLFPSAVVPFAVAGAILLASCGGSADADDELDLAAAHLAELEDDVDELSRLLATTSTTVPPPVTQATAPPTTRAPTERPTTTTETTAAPAISDATEDQIRAIVGPASWDASLPIPRECIDNATFVPAGEIGINGGLLTCTVAAPSSQLEEYFRFALTRRGFRFDATGNDAGFSIAIGPSATIAGSADGDSTSVTIEQRFP